MSCQLHAPAGLVPGKGPPVPTGQEARWAPEPIWMWWLRERIPVPARDRTPVIQPTV